jgi:hypothetical protein
VGRRIFENLVQESTESLVHEAASIAYRLLQETEGVVEMLMGAVTVQVGGACFLCHASLA